MIASVLAEQTFALPANIAFGIAAIVMVGCALRVVTTKNVVHAAGYLVVVLFGVSVNFLLLQAEFLAMTQLLVYVGAIVVLMLFAIMLTKAPLGNSEDLDNPVMKVPGAAAALALLVVTGGSNLATFSDDKIPFAAENSVEAVSDSIFSTFVLPFEVVSVLLLAALIGAIVLARKD